MRRVALKGLAWRKIRGVLTALAIILGVAMVSGAFILTDTMKKAADNLEAGSYAGIDGIVTGVANFRDDNSWQKTPSISQGLVVKVVARAAGRHRRGLRPRPGEARERQGRGDRKPAELRGRYRRDAGWCGSGEPAHARLRALGDAAQRGRDRRRYGRTRASPRRRLSRRRRSRPRQAVQDRRARQVRERRLARRGNRRRLRPEHGPGAVRQARAGGHDLDRRPSGRDARGGAQRCRSCARSDLHEGADGERGGSVRLRGPEGLRHVHQGLPARLRRGRALRRRVHHLQHVLDHRRAADAGVRAAADDRRVAPPGPALGRARGVPDRSGRNRSRCRPGIAHREVPERRDEDGRDRPAAGGDRLRASHGAREPARGRPRHGGGRADPRGARDTRAARCGAPRGLGAPEVARVSCDAVHRDRPGRRRVRRAGLRDVRGRRRRVRARPRHQRPEHSQCSSASRCWRRGSFARSPGSSAHPRPASPVHPGASHARTRRGTRVGRP